ncbi:site-2 protease family protein [Leptolyngbya cf. ectocarpi LEGE 11479]|uniref:Zinc metalloprotease n=1 Tax=Leptolyngbya cf. ectocarpi LEGE 11479 TaxID=1828722 RepID=A0A928X173_LEPEC|nr:site-2 protease family protein [Leptolyngbya ectocarpi]MBE9066035.1 site-2 protease family protein [Leptolyngbya cf. ectocarpi LEGE 11479]
MNGNLRVGNLFGIPFFINISWFFVLALTTLNFGGGLAAQFPWLGGGALVLGLVAGLLLFGSVLLHELGHSFAARQQGISVNSITLFLFGGLASLDDEAKTPAGAFWIAIAGPLVSLALFALLTLVASSGLVTGPIAAVTGLLAYINLILATFNMIPGLPLDGGNVLKAIVWKLSGNRYRGIRWASRTGQIIGWSAIGLGTLAILGLSNIGSFWTLIIGWFILQNAGRSAQSATVQETLSGLTAADAVLEHSPIIGIDSTLRDLADTVIVSNSNRPWRRFLVKADDERLMGSIELETLKTVPSDQWSAYQVQDFLKPIEQETRVQADRPLLDVIQQLEKQGTQALAVTTENGTLVGLLEKAEIINLLQQKAQPA